jgi:short-subunit dehydrogenase
MSHRMITQFHRRYGPWAVVTGASSGIGRATAEALAAGGFHLVLVARREAELAALADEWRSQHKIQARVIAGDLAELAGCEQVIRGTEDLEVGLLVAAAGFGTSGEFVDADLAAELSLLHVNCRATTILCRHFAGQLAARGRGGMVLFGSLVGFQGTPFAAHYAATKAYVQTLGEALHVELASAGVDVLVSAPGPVHSGFAQRAKMVIGWADRPETVARDTLKQLGRRMTVTPGWRGRFLTWSLQTAPRRWRVRIMQKIMGGMTRNFSCPQPEITRT